MKRFSRLLMVSAFSIAALMAQRPGPMRGGGTPPDPATMVERRVERMKEFLNLTDAQVTQLKSIYTNAAAEAQPIQTQMREAHEGLRDAVKANNTQNIDQLANTIGGLTAKLTAIHSKAQAAVYTLLTDEQRTKVENSGHGMGMMGPMMGPGMDGGMGPRGMRPGAGMGSRNSQR